MVRLLPILALSALVAGSLAWAGNKVTENGGCCLMGRTAKAAETANKAATAARPTDLDEPGLMRREAQGGHLHCGACPMKGSGDAVRAKSAPSAGRVKTASFEVAALKCGGCASRVRTALQAAKGVKSVEIDLGKKLVTVSYDPKVVSSYRIAALSRETLGGDRAAKE